MLSVLLPQRRAAANPDDERYWTGGDTYRARTKSGIAVDSEVGLTHATVFFCTRIITEGIAGMPIVGYRRTEKGGREAAKDDEILRLAELLSLAPNEEMTAMPWREGRTNHQVNNGNGYSEIVRDSRGRPEGLYPIHPSRVAKSRDERYAYEVLRPDGKIIYFSRDEMLHVCGTLSDDGIFGRGVIQYARESIGYGLAIQRHGSAYFGNGAQPKGLFIIPGMSREDRRDLRRELNEVHKEGSSEALILPKDGSDYKPIFISNQDSQFLGSQEWSAIEIGKWYRVARYIIEGMELKGSEAVGADFVTFTLYPWVKKQEEAFNCKLLTRKQRGEFFFEHDFSSMLRGNREARYNSYRTGITSGVLTINDCCRLENLPDIGPAGDLHYLPANLITSERMERDGGSAMSGPGSDHTGAPADSPLDHQDDKTPDPTRQQRADMESQLKRLHGQLEDRSTEWAQAARSVLKEVLTRMLTKEANAAGRVGDGKDAFDVWRREFYAKHEPLMADALRPACEVLSAAGLKKWQRPQDLAAYLCAKSEETLVRSKTQDTKEAFAKKLAAWPTERVRQIAEEVLAA